MAEWATVIEAWFDADNDEDANAVVKSLTERVLEHPNVSMVEAERPEQTDA